MINKNVLLLALSQAFSMTSGTVVVLAGGLVGTELAPIPVLATMPVALMIIGVAISTIPASMVMARLGRRPGFIGASMMASGASLIGALAIQTESFYLFCFATTLIGTSLAFAQHYRFAAAESVEAGQASSAISFILLGGIVAAILGPSMASLSKDWTSAPYQGSFISLALLTLVPAMFLVFYRERRSPMQDSGASRRRLTAIIFTPGFLVAMASSTVGYAVMSFIMTATPISMHHLDNHSFDDTALVIQWHVVAMYLPSLISGRLVKAWGLQTIMVLGVVALFACILVAVASHNLVNYWVALVLLGIGWNFLFVSGTSKLTLHYRPEERFKAQAANDFSVFAIQAAASLSAGWALHAYSWELVNYACLPLLLLMLLAIAYEYRSNRRAVVNRP